MAQPPADHGYIPAVARIEANDGYDALVQLEGLLRGSTRGGTVTRTVSKETRARQPGAYPGY